MRGYEMDVYIVRVIEEHMRWRTSTAVSLSKLPASMTREGQFRMFTLSVASYIQRKKFCTYITYNNNNKNSMPVRNWPALSMTRL